MIIFYSEGHYLKPHPGLVIVKSVSTPWDFGVGAAGDWRIGRARKDQGTRRMGQPAGLKRLSFILRVKGS